MNIAVVTREFSPLTRNGGIGTAMRCLCEFLAVEGGHAVTVYYTGRPHPGMALFAEAMRRRGLRFRPVVSLPGLLLRDPVRRSRKAFSVLVGAQHDVCLFHEFMADGLFCLRTRRRGEGLTDMPMGVVTHGSSLWVDEGNGCVSGEGKRRELYAMERECCALADFLVSPSRYLLGWMRERGWTLPRDTRCIPNFTALPGSVPPRPDGAGQDGTVELVFFGRLEERKGVRVFCEALALLSPELLSGRRVTFLGKEAGFRAADVRAMLARQTAAGLQLALLTGLGPDEARRYLCAGRRLAVMPSLRENSPCVVAECLESGIPFLASSVGGGRELAREEDRNNVFCVPETTALAERLRRALQDGNLPAGRPAHTRETLFAQWQELLREQALQAA
ncbi:glycosyltransferase family 4 protein [Desulfovibrio sp. ZJ200]|uniref:glycosyltransferase family 4 protein n=1 Tax=Desulfovibrio sp. ZJ200 TaxID=2709792 RepID=UPI001F150A77|nr:glycosyltransferase family 4 protein [Desulfovibrio sp. ZJ200]